MTHDLIILHKTGEETGRHLLSASCLCGWRSNTWYSGEQYVRDSFALHTRALANPNAPEAGK